MSNYISYWRDQTVHSQLCVVMDSLNCTLYSKALSFAIHMSWHLYLSSASWTIRKSLEQPWQEARRKGGKHYSSNQTFFVWSIFVPVKIQYSIYVFCIGRKLHLTKSLVHSQVSVLYLHWYVISISQPAVGRPVAVSMATITVGKTEWTEKSCLEGHI